MKSKSSKYLFVDVIYFLYSNDENKSGKMCMDISNQNIQGSRLEMPICIVLDLKLLRNPQDLMEYGYSIESSVLYCVG